MVLLLLTFFAVATPLFLRILASDLFRIPYITWYMLHWGVAVTAMLVLAILALAGLLSSPLIALFASVFGYVLGSQGTRGTSPDTGTPKTLAIHKILPPSASPGSTVTITGQGFDQGVTVLFGSQPMAQTVVAADGSMLSGILSATAAKGKVDVVVKNPSGAAQTMTQAFEVV